jgi:N-carbamoyl-L-amino-acid hydrolase
MDRRSDAGVAAARVVVGLADIARREGGVCTAGRLDLLPGIATAVPGRAELLVDQRHLDPGALAAMLAGARELWRDAAAQEGCTVEDGLVWRIDPTPFDRRLVSAARAACREAAGAERALASGALHDAAQMAQLAPSVMVFSSSSGGVSHAPQEDTPEPALERALEAFGLLAHRVIEGGVR